MTTYEVEVWRTYVKFTTVTVQADNEDDAGDIAMTKADFSSASLNADETGYESVRELTEEEV